MTTYSDIRYDMTFSTSATNVGGMVLLATETASSSDTISFTSLIDSTYKEYIFKFIGIHPETNSVNFSVGFRDGGSAYDATKTTTLFDAFHNEGDTNAGMTYETGLDIAQGTGFQRLDAGDNIGADNDQCLTGYLHLFDPASTTFVKHFRTRITHSGQSDYAADTFTAGYCNVTAAIDGVQFKMSSDAIDAGVIKMYGVL